MREHHQFLQKGPTQIQGIFIIADLRFCYNNKTTSSPGPSTTGGADSELPDAEEGCEGNTTGGGGVTQEPGQLSPLEMSALGRQENGPAFGYSGRQRAQQIPEQPWSLGSDSGLHAQCLDFHPCEAGRWYFS